MNDELKNKITNTDPSAIELTLEKMQEKIEACLPGRMSMARMKQIILTAITKNPNLEKCTPVTLFTAIMQAAQLGLEVNTVLGEAFLIPYPSKGRYDCEFQLGYHGILKLAWQSRIYQYITAHTVHESDELVYEYGTNQFLKHKVKRGLSRADRGKVTEYYAVWRGTNGGCGFVVWTARDVFEHAKKFSKSWDDGKKQFRYGSAWLTNYDSQALKTVLINLLKYAPKSVQFAQQLDADGITRQEMAEKMTDVDGVHVEREAGEEKVSGGYDQEGARKEVLQLSIVKKDKLSDNQNQYFDELSARDPGLYPEKDYIRDLERLKKIK